MPRDGRVQIDSHGCSSGRYGKLFRKTDRFQTPQYLQEEKKWTSMMRQKIRSDQLHQHSMDPVHRLYPDDRSRRRGQCAKDFIWKIFSCTGRSEPDFDACFQSDAPRTHGRRACWEVLRTAAGGLQRSFCFLITKGFRPMSSEQSGSAGLTSFKKENSSAPSAEEFFVVYTNSLAIQFTETQYPRLSAFRSL